MDKAASKEAKGLIAMIKVVAPQMALVATWLPVSKSET